jgi:hypothetical protein
MQEGLGGQDQPPADGPEYPKVVRIAGVIWIVFGSLILLNSAVNLLVTFSTAAGGGAQTGDRVFVALLAMLIGAVFIHAGLQSTRGTAKDTLGNGIGSIIFAGLIGGAGVLLLLGSLVVGGTVGLIGAVLGGINLLNGVGLLAAGVLALLGRHAYKAWRRAQQSRVGGGGTSP